jgi:NitT/TauT family transport system ATP-binding protein
MAAALGGRIGFHGVSKAYVSVSGAEYLAVRDIDLEIGQGDFMCVLGPSGCGKTTLLTMLAGFEEPSGGEILLDSIPVRQPGADRGVVFQSHDSLFPWLTALDNVEFGLRMRGMPKAERRDRALHYINLVGLRGQEAKHPTELSGGMKQRIQIARVLANEPKVLLMDEPFAALDAQTRAVLQQELHRIWRSTGQTVLFITHDIDEALMLATRVAVMQAGPASRIKGVLPVDLEPEERERTNPRFIEHYRVVRDMIREEVARALGDGH